MRRVLLGLGVCALAFYLAGSASAFGQDVPAYPQPQPTVVQTYQPIVPAPVIVTRPAPVIVAQPSVIVAPPQVVIGVPAPIGVYYPGHHYYRPRYRFYP
jgi:hypothetical protein